MLIRTRKDILHIIAKSEIFQRLLDVLAGNRLLGFLLANVVGLGGDERDEFDAAFHEQVARIFGKGLAGGRGEDFGDDFLDGRCSYVSAYETQHIHYKRVS